MLHYSWSDEEKVKSIYFPNCFKAFLNLVTLWLPSASLPNFIKNIPFLQGT